GPRFRRTRRAPRQPGTALRCGDALHQPGELRRRQGRRRDSDRGHGGGAGARTRPGVEGLPQHHHRRRGDGDPGRDRRAGGDPAPVVHRPPPALAEPCLALLLGRGGDAERRGPARRPVLQRLEPALQRRVVAGRGQPGRRLQLVLGAAVPPLGPDRAREPVPGPGPRLLLPDHLRPDPGARGPGVLPRPMAPFQSAAGRGGAYPAGRRPRPGSLRRHLPGLAGQPQRLVGRGRDQVLPGWRRRLADHLRHRHRGLLWRGLELRAPEGRIRRLLHPIPGAAAGHQTGRPLRRQPALRHVPLARSGPDPLQGRAAGDDPGPRLADPVGGPGPLPPPPGRHRLDRVLVPDRAARAVPAAAGRERAGGGV
ncbi:MAG: FIG01197961: hypothetical protein, partial [uncultured Thermomicrobiales bacterium]